MIPACTQRMLKGNLVDGSPAFQGERLLFVILVKLSNYENASDLIIDLLQLLLLLIFMRAGCLL